LTIGDAPSGIGGQSSCTIRNNAGIGARLKYGGVPSSSSMTKHPTLLGPELLTRKNQNLKSAHHISDAVVAPDCSITSGATRE